MRVLSPSEACAFLSATPVGSSSALADRLNIVQGPAHMSENMLSVQAILSCGNDATQCGTCNGGDDGPVYQWAKKSGIPGESCSNYMAVDTTCRAEKPTKTYAARPCTPRALHAAARARARAPSPLPLPIL